MATEKIMSAARAELLDVIKRVGAISRGQYTLSDGAVSDWYFDGRRVLNHPTGAFAAGGAIERAMRVSGARAVGGPAMGAISLVSAVVTFNGDAKPVIERVGGELIAVEPPEITGFYVRHERKEHGERRLIEGLFPDDPRVPVAVVDDVVNSGASIIRAIDAIEARGNPIVLVTCLLDRNEGGREALSARGYELKSILTTADVLSADADIGGDSRRALLQNAPYKLLGQDPE